MGFRGGAVASSRQCGVCGGGFAALPQLTLADRRSTNVIACACVPPPRRPDRLRGRGRGCGVWWVGAWLVGCGAIMPLTRRSPACACAPPPRRPGRLRVRGFGVWPVVGWDCGWCVWHHPTFKPLSWRQWLKCCDRPRDGRWLRSGKDDRGESPLSRCSEVIPRVCGRLLFLAAYIAPVCGGLTLVFSLWRPSARRS